MKYEIEMLSIGNADSSIVRYINEAGSEYVVLIDAGNPSDGKAVVSQIKNYTTQKYIDLAICTHPDKDHIGGFFEVVDKLKINQFWIHDPAKHVDMDDVKKSISVVNVYKSLRFLTESFDDSRNLLNLIDSKKIPREEPFAGLTHPSIPVTIVGPTKEYYEELLGGFRDITHLFKEGDYFEKSLSDFVKEGEEETLSATLDEKNDKSNENNSSALCCFIFDGRKHLFTADAGPDALFKAKATYNISKVYWMQIPHHGSKYNLTSDLILHFDPHVSCVSASGSKRYPNRATVNAMKSVHCAVYSTQDGNKLYNAIEDRAGYVAATPL